MREVHRVKRATAVMAVLLGGAPMQSIATTGLCEEWTSNTLQDPGSSRSRCLLLGGGVLGGESEYLSDDLSDGFPVVYLGYGPFYWDTTEIGFYVLGSQHADRYRRATILLELPDYGFRVDGEEHLAGLSDREPTIEGGVKFETGGPWGNLMVGATIDLEGEHDGVRGYSRYAYPIELGNFVVSPELSVTYRDRKSNDYYYGESGDERPEHAAYNANEETLTPGFGYTMSYTFDSGLSLIHSLSGRLLDELNADSPLTVEDAPITASAGVLYRVF